jgi:hypothetical protein
MNRFVKVVLFLVALVGLVGCANLQMPHAQRILVVVNESNHPLEMAINATPLAVLAPGKQWAVDIARYWNFQEVVITAQAKEGETVVWTRTERFSTGNNNGGYYYYYQNGYDGSSSVNWNIREPGRW